MAYWLYYFGRNSGRPLGHKVSPCPARPPPLPSGGGSRQINSAAAFSLNTQIFKSKPCDPGPSDQPSHLPSPTLPSPLQIPTGAPRPPCATRHARTAWDPPQAVRCVFVCDRPTGPHGNLNTCCLMCSVCGCCLSDVVVGVVCLLLLWERCFRSVCLERFRVERYTSSVLLGTPVVALQN